MYAGGRERISNASIDIDLCKEIQDLGKLWATKIFREPRWKDRDGSIMPEKERKQVLPFERNVYTERLARVSALPSFPCKVTQPPQRLKHSEESLS